ncbi:hypothetical protein GCM10023189_50300 [Nibrella saemangeumensis]|uniref:Uncharacterized protein n=1 Tax=Nibrella saemangeumensis TaxID=1084526 RepID=A0ABP8NK55_9BACT
MAYCGTFPNTFGPNPRDNTTYNGIGFNLMGNVDYFLTPSTRRLRFALGTAFGYQNYWMRQGYKDNFLDRGVALGYQRNQIQIRARAGDDFYLTIGPMLSWTFARSRRNPTCTSFLELALRGGLFRSESALIAAYVPSTANPGQNELVRMVTPTDRIWKLGGLGSLGVFFPLRNNWHLGVQGNVFYTKVDYFIVDGVSPVSIPGERNILWEFSRKHGGFSAGLAVRKGFVQKKLIPKAPIVCPTCDSIPDLRVSFNNMSLAGMTLRYDSIQRNTLPIMSWRSTTVAPRNETFTARLHYKSDSLEASPERIIAEVVNSSDTSLVFPAAYVDTAGRPLRGFYYITVHSRQEAQCGSCVSEVATASWAIVAPQGCEYRHNYDQLTFKFHLTYDDTFTVFCNCPGQERQPIGTVKGRRRFYNWSSLGLDSLRGSSTMNTITVQLGDTLDFVTKDPTARLTDAAYSAVRATRDELARRIEQAAQNNPALRGKRPRVVFDEIRGSYSIEQTKPCNGENTVAPVQRYNYYYFNKTNDYTLDYLGTNTLTVPAPQLLPQTQLQRRTTPAPRRTTTPRRRR